MKIYNNVDVLTAAKERFRWIYDEFENVVVSTSGGKDSTICFHLALEAAKEKGRLPIKVMWLDQEAEWQATVDSVRYMMEHPDVEPYWMQIPFRLFNATSQTDNWLNCWEPGKEDLWMRPQEKYSYKENIFGTDRFAKLFPALTKGLWPDQTTAVIGGVRCEESPARYLGLTGSATHKWVTWGQQHLPNVTLYPIYDWGVRDVWKAILDHGWPYCKMYDIQYQYGVPLNSMRVSNVHHETAVSALFYMQEAEPQTYERLVQRVSGIHMAGHMGLADYFPKTVPPMFNGWREYRDFLLEKMIDKPEWKVNFQNRFKKQEEYFLGEHGDHLFKVHIRSILVNDWEGVLLQNLKAAPNKSSIRRKKERNEAKNI